MRIVLEQKDITVLAIESSCDETAAAVVVNGRKVLSNIIASQIDIHKLYGGVVPEIASRKHIEKINQVIDEALTEAGKTLDDMDAVCVTYGPGLVGALLVGVGAAKVRRKSSTKKNIKPTTKSGRNVCVYTPPRAFSCPNSARRDSFPQ